MTQRLRTPLRAADASVGAHARRLAVLKVILAASVVSTALHFSHNFVEIERYPQSDLISNQAVQAAIIVSWPLLTAIGLIGYRLYSQKRYAAAHSCLAIYSFLGITTLAHFLEGSPDIPPFWYATIITDGLAGFAVLTFTVRSALVPAPAGTAVHRPRANSGAPRNRA
jgi:hypothetical protein